MAPAQQDRRRYRQTATRLLPILFCLAFSTRVGATDSAALSLLRDIQAIETEQGILSPALVPPLLQLGRIYSGGQCENAIDILDVALQVSRRNEGLFNPRQLDIYEPMLDCYVNLDRPVDLQMAQQYIVMIDEQRYGPKDLRLLSTLDRGAHRYEDVGLYLSARRLQRRAIDIIDRVVGKNSLSLVRPLRGMARAFRQEYAYGLALPDGVDAPTDMTDLPSYATFDERAGARLDRLGQRSLERALIILRTNPEADRDERVATQLELGDWYQLDENRRDALRTYRALWNEGHADLLASAEPLLMHATSGLPLRRTPVDGEDQTRYIIDLEYTVTRDGWAKDVKVTESNAPRRYNVRATEDLKHARFRPRFASGEPVDSPGEHHRLNIYVPKQTE